MNGVGQDECAGSSGHLGLNERLAEAQFAQYGSHVDPTGNTNHRKSVSWDQKVFVCIYTVRSTVLYVCLCKTLQMDFKSVPSPSLPSHRVAADGCLSLSLLLPEVSSC